MSEIGPSQPKTVEQIAPHKRLRADFETGFHEFVATETRGEKVQLPRFINEATGKVDPAWANKQRERNNKLVGREDGTSGPDSASVLAGAIKYNDEEKKYYAVDPDSPIGQIEALRAEAQTALDNNVDTAGKKKLESKIRKELAGIYNDFAGMRFNLERDVVNGGDFRGVTLQNVAHRELPIWRRDLVRKRQQAIEPRLYDKWELSGVTLKTPSRADHYMNNLLDEMASIKDPHLRSPEAQVLQGLFEIQGPEGYIDIANILYSGDMNKAYHNISALCKARKVSIPERWRIYSGTTTEFRNVQKHMDTFTAGIDGYIDAANRMYGGDMAKAYRGISSVAHMTDASFPEGWQRFEGTTHEFTSLRGMLGDVSPGLTGYIEIADALYDGDMGKTFKNISAVANMTGESIPKDWKQFQGDTDSFRRLQERIPLLKPGAEGIIEVADEFYDGDMKKTINNFAAVASMSELKLPKDWKEFRGTTTEFRELQTRLNTVTEDDMDYVDIAIAFYDGDMGKAYRNLSAVAQLSGIRLPETWRLFRGTADEFNAIKDSFDEIDDNVDGFLSLATNKYKGDLKLTFSNVSAVSRMSGKSFPETWRYFNGDVSEFNAINDLLDTLDNNVDSYISLANERYQGDLQKAFVNASAVAEMKKKTLPEKWKVFNGTVTEFNKIKDAFDTIEDSLDGYITFANTHYKGDLKKTFLNTSSVAEMIGRKFPETWSQYDGNVEDLTELIELFDTIGAGVDGYITLANDRYNGDMTRTYNNVSSVAQMAEKEPPEGWFKYGGSVRQYDKQQQWLNEHPDAEFSQFTIQFNITGKQISRAYDNFNAIKKMEAYKRADQESESDQEG